MHILNSLNCFLYDYAKIIVSNRKFRKKMSLKKITSLCAIEKTNEANNFHCHDNELTQLFLFYSLKMWTWIQALIRRHNYEHYLFKLLYRAFV